MNEELIDNSENNIESEHKFKPNSLIIWYIITFIGLFFKILHWPGFILIIVIGISGSLAFSISRLISWKKISLYAVIVSLISFIWPIYVYSTLIRFRQNNPYSLFIVFVLTLFVLVVYELFKRKNKKNDV